MESFDDPGSASLAPTEDEDAAAEAGRESPFSESFQFRDDERTGMEALFARAFFDTPFTTLTRAAIERTRFVPGAGEAVESAPASPVVDPPKEASSESSADAGSPDRKPSAGEAPADAREQPRYVVLYRGANGIGKTRTFRQVRASARERKIPIYEVHYHDVEGIPFKPFLHAIRAILRDHDRGSVLQDKYRYALEGLIPELFGEKNGSDIGEWIPPEKLEAEKVRLFDGITQLLLEVTAQRPLLLLVHDLHWSDVPTIELLRYIGRNLDLRNRPPERTRPAIIAPLDGGLDLDALGEDGEAWGTLSRGTMQSGDYVSNLARLADGTDRQTMPPARLMILANYRGFEARDHYLERSIVALGQESFAFHGELRLLREEEADQFVERAVDGVEVEGRALSVESNAVDLIYEVSEGFPSYSKELLRALYYDRHLSDLSRAGDGVWSAERLRAALDRAQPADASSSGPSDRAGEAGDEAEGSSASAAAAAPAPDGSGEAPAEDRARAATRRDLILKLRLRGASEDELGVLRVLAIARRPLTADIVSGVIASDVDVVPVFEGLVGRGVLEKSEGGDDAPRYFFRLWDYVRVVTDEIADDDKRQIHQKLGELYRASGDAASGESEYEVFYHLNRGVEPRSSVEHGLIAARWFLRSVALEKAREIYDHLLALLTEEDRAQRIDILELQARISLALDQGESAEKQLRQALEEGASTLEPDRQVEFCLLESEAVGRRDPARGLKVLNKAPRLLSDESSRLGVRVQMQLARLRLRRQDVKRAINLSLKGRDLCLKLGDLPELGELYRQMASAFYHKGDYAHAVDNYQRALTVFEKLELKEPLVATLDELGRVYLERGNYFRSARYLYRSLEIRRREHDIAGLCRSYDELGMVYLRSGDYLKTIENLNLSLSLKERIGDFAGLHPTLSTLGDLYARLGLFEHSLAYLQRAVATSQKLGDTEGLVDGLARLGRVHFELGDCRQAESLAKQVEILASEFKLRSEEADGMFLEGHLRAFSRDWPEAEKKLRQAAEIHAKLGHRRREADALLELAEVKLQRELYDESLKVASKGHIAADELKALDLQVRALVLKGNIHRFLKGGNNDKAREFFGKALELSQNLGDVGELFELFYSLAKLCHSEREFSEASNYYGKAEFLLQQVGRWLSDDLTARFFEDPRRKVFAEDLARFRRESAGRAAGTAVDLREPTTPARAVQDRPVRVGDYKALVQRVLRLHSGLNDLHFYDRLLADAVELGGAERGFVLRVENRQYVPVAFHGFGKTPLQHPEFMVASHLTQECIRKGRSIVSSGTQDETDPKKGGRLDRRLQLGYLDHRSILAVPCLTEDRIFGGVYLDKPVTLGVFEARDQVLLESFAQHAAAALVNRYEFETAIREPVTGFYTPSYFVDRLRDAFRLFNLHGREFSLLGFYLPNLDDMLGDGRGQLGSNLARTLGAALPSRASICWGNPILYVLLEERDATNAAELLETVGANLSATINDDVASAVIPAARHFQQGADIYFEMRARLLPEECDQKTLGALRSVLTPDMTLRDAKRIVERLKIESTLKKTGGNITHAARELGIHRPQLSNLLKKYELKRESFGSAGSSNPPGED